MPCPNCGHDVSQVARVYVVNLAGGVALGILLASAVVAALYGALRLWQSMG